MQINRRLFGLGLLGLGLSACSRAFPGSVSTSTPTGLPADLRPVPNAAYDVWVASFRGRAAAQGISQSTLNAAFRGTGFLPGVVTRDRNQTEFSRTLEDYLSIATSDERVQKGRAAFARHRGTLSALQDRYGVLSLIHI